MADLALRLTVADHGEVAAVFGRPPEGAVRGALVLAHGAQNDLRHGLLGQLHAAVVAAGFGCLRFNFPYREAGRWPPDAPDVLAATYRAAAETLAARLELAPERLVLGGKSLGARVAAEVAAAGCPARGLLFLGYPLHSADDVRPKGVDTLLGLHVPMLFLRGTHDPLCQHGALQALTARLSAPFEVHAVAEGDHSFECRHSVVRSTANAWLEVVRVAVHWLRERFLYPVAAPTA